MASTGADVPKVTTFEQYAGVPVPMPAERPPPRQGYVVSRNARGDRSAPVTDIGHADPSDAHWTTCGGQRRSYPLIGWSMPSQGEAELEAVGTYDGLTVSMRRMPDTEREQTQNMRGPEHIEPYDRDPFRNRVETTPIEELQFVNDMDPAGAPVGVSEQRQYHIEFAQRNHNADTLSNNQEDSVPITYGDGGVREWQRRDAGQVISTKSTATQAPLREGPAGADGPGARAATGEFSGITPINCVTLVMRPTVGSATHDSGIVQPTVESTLPPQQLDVVEFRNVVSVGPAVLTTGTDRPGSTPISQLQPLTQSLPGMSGQPPTETQRVTRDDVDNTMSDRGSSQAPVQGWQESESDQPSRPAVAGTTPSAQISGLSLASYPESDVRVVPEVPAGVTTGNVVRITTVPVPGTFRFAPDVSIRQWGTESDASRTQQSAQSASSNRPLGPQVRGTMLSAQAVASTDMYVEPLDRYTGLSDGVPRPAPPSRGADRMPLPSIQAEPRTVEQQGSVLPGDIGVQTRAGLPGQTGIPSEVVSGSIPLPYQVREAGVGLTG